MLMEREKWTFYHFIRLNGFVKSPKTPLFVIPAKARHVVALFKRARATLSAIQSFQQLLDAGSSPA